MTEEEKQKAAVEEQRKIAIEFRREALSHILKRVSDVPEEFLEAGWQPLVRASDGRIDGWRYTKGRMPPFPDEPDPNEDVPLPPDFFDEFKKQR